MRALLQAFVNTMHDLPFVVRWTVYGILFLTGIVSIEVVARRIVQGFKRGLSKRPRVVTCGDDLCGLQFPGYWLDQPEPKPHKLAGWTCEDGQWYCRSHNSGKQIPLPFKTEALKPKSDEAQVLSDYYRRRRDTF